MADIRGKNVYVGLSGGVDSSVTAALLLEQGAQVHGVFIQGWYPPHIECTWKEDRHDAMRVAAHLGIPFTTLDASKEYKKFVIDYLLAEYKAGRTPNPDILCNREVKFGAFYRFAMEHKADFVATGHYAKIHDGSLYRGVDDDKDQSYFLWAIGKEQLPHILFPLGGLAKSEVRTRAENYDLPTARKKDSQGICFLGNISMDTFLHHEFEITEGDAYTLDGRRVGTHAGALLYTLGERVPISGSEPGPWFVILKDIEKNELHVSHELTSSKETNTLSLSSANYHEAIKPDEILTAQYRYHGPHVNVRIDTEHNHVTFVEPLAEVLATGQSLVLYRGEKLLGGGIIEA